MPTLQLTAQRPNRAALELAAGRWYNHFTPACSLNLFAIRPSLAAAQLIATLALLAFFFSGCASAPPTPQTIRGKYELRGKGFYAGESFEISDGNFTYSRFSDALDSPAIRGMPVHGRYTLSGTTIVFHHPRIVNQERTLVRRFGKFTLWTSRQRAEFEKTGRPPDDILYQTR